MIEKITQATAHAVDALKGSPVLLALVLFMFVFCGVVVWVSHEQRAYEHAQFELLLKQCGNK